MCILLEYNYNTGRWHADTLIDFLKDEVEQKRNRESGGYSL